MLVHSGRGTNEPTKEATPDTWAGPSDETLGWLSAVEEPSSRCLRVVVAAVVVVIGALVGMGLAGENPAPAERNPVAVAAGEEIFVASCAVCHGPGLKGSPTGQPLLAPTYAPNHHGGEAFQRAVAFSTQTH